MYLRHLSLADFRSYAAAEVALEPGPTVFVGPNGQGKTNLVEAAGYLATQSSHRVATDAPLVRHGAERAAVRGAIVRDDRELLAEIEIWPGRANRARLSRAPVSRPRELLGVLRTVLFAPEDLALVKGDPSERRHFLDELLSLRAPRYAGVRADYERVLRQRNALLKSARSSSDLRTLDVWDGHLARHGAELLAGRLELVEALRPLVDKAYDAVSDGTGPARLDYRSSLSLLAEGPCAADSTLDRPALAEALLADVGRLRGQEVERGVSLVGPHRDDLLLQLGALPARGYASHGESWSYALALRLASYELLTGDGGEPVLILDDVFAELDSRRRGRLGELAARAGQVLVTAAVADDVPPELRGVRYEVAAGEVRRAG